MSAATYREEPGKVASGVMAVAVHIAFFVLLVIGVSWQRKVPETVVVELWNNLPPAPAVRPPEVAPAPPFEVKPLPPQIKPEPKVETKPAPEPKPVAKPDIALEKEKQEKARREREEKDKAEQKKRDDQAKADARKREEAEKQKIAALEADRAAKEAMRARLEKEQHEAVQRLQQQQAAAQKSEIDSYQSKIQQKIKRYVVKGPCDSLRDPEILLEVNLMPDGNTLAEPMIRRSSGSAACDQTVLRAAVRAQPLPIPPPGHPLLDQFRNFNLRFKPNE